MTATPTTSSTSKPHPLFWTPAPDYVPGAWFDQAAVDRIVRVFAELRHVKGRFAGRPLILDDWQLEWLIAPVFGWKHPDGTRIVRECWWELPRKNAKSTLASGIAIYGTSADREPGAEVYAAAGDRRQARQVFDPAAAMATSSPSVSKVLRPFRTRIVAPKTNSFFEVLSSDANLKHGFNVHMAIIDEIHVHKNMNLIEALESGTGSRQQPLIVKITTADDGESGSAYDRNRMEAEKVSCRLRSYDDKGRPLARPVVEPAKVRDPTMHVCIFAAEEHDDPFAVATIEKANPGIDKTVTRAYLLKEAEKAKTNPARLAAYKRLHLGIRTSRVTKWIPLSDWDRTAGLVDELRLAGREAFAGLDLASTTDVAALNLTFVDASGDQPIYEAIWRFWIPEARLHDLDERTAGAASVWRREGVLTVTDGNVIDYTAIREELGRLAERFDIRELAFDRWGATQLAQELREDGLLVVPFGQGFKDQSPPTKELERVVLDGRYRHGGNPMMRWMFGNIALRTDPAGNIKVAKDKSADKVDGVVAAIMGLARAVVHTPSFYEDSGLRTV